jgi:hypothetical protein
MNCNRCGGKMFNEKILYGAEHFSVWRCVYCGEYIDRVTLENRSLVEMGRVPKTRNRRR